jgi:hypothetical protein
MSFTGDLEHLPIVDVIQLLHATRKSGILRISCHKGESQLVFKDGFIVSANHLNNTVRIGQILVDLGLITPVVLDRMLREQKEAGNRRKPLIITLIEKGLVNERDAYKGLEELIEMTVVEILSWKGGTFTLDVMPQSVDDEYRYFPEKMSREINVDTQGILMNALRIFDEKKRDGQIEEDDDDSVDIEFALQPTPPQEEEKIISAEDLGLDDIDHLESKLPQAYTVLDDDVSTANHARMLANLAPELSETQLDELDAFLGSFSSTKQEADLMGKGYGKTRNVLFYSCDELLSYCIATTCRDTGLSVFVTSDEQDLDHLIDRFEADGIFPLLLLDAPGKGIEGASSEKISRLRSRKRDKYRRLPIIQISSLDDNAFVMEAYRDNVRAVFPGPPRKTVSEGFVPETIVFIQTLLGYLRNFCLEGEISDLSRLSKSFSEMRDMTGAPDAAFILLKSLAEIFERAVTLIVRENELCAEKGIGIKAPKGSGIIPSMGFRIPRSKRSHILDVIESGRLFYGHLDDELAREYLYSQIGAPRVMTAFMLPLRYRGKTISITYGDFGEYEPVAVDTGQLEILASQAEVALENAIYRKKMDNSASRG